MDNIKTRAFTALNLLQYHTDNKPDECSQIDLDLNTDTIKVLRMLIQKPNEDLKLPDEFQWVLPMLEHSIRHQHSYIHVHHPFCYLTIRQGIFSSKNQEDWHIDGFSMNITHLPEQNYIWVNNHPTEYVDHKFVIPLDFNPYYHNLHWLLKEQVKNDLIKQVKPKTLYCFDPYILHRKPLIEEDVFRTFIRISFTPIEIPDCNNTINPLLPTNYTRDGVKEFRNKLKNYTHTRRLPF